MREGIDIDALHLYNPLWCVSRGPSTKASEEVLEENCWTPLLIPLSFDVGAPDGPDHSSFI